MFKSPKEKSHLEEKDSYDLKEEFASSADLSVLVSPPATSADDENYCFHAVSIFLLFKAIKRYANSSRRPFHVE